MKTIFVSSTFKDFQVERDALNSKVRPALSREAGQYGETVDFCDLRWGIDTSADSEEAATQKILSVCLEQIDRSSPYMVVLLGDRYGYIPGADQVRDALQQRSVAADWLEDLEISITQLEIEYGLLSRPQNKPHVYVYVRRLSGGHIPAEYASESALHRQKLDALLQRILAFTDGRARYYDICLENGEFRGLDRFVQMVRQDLQEDLQEEWESFGNMPPFEKERRLQWKQIGEKKERLRMHKALAEELLEKVLEGEMSRFWALRGSSGCGKSVLFSYVCHSLEQRGVTVIPALCQSSAVTGDPSVLLDYLIFHMENVLDRQHRSFDLNSGSAALNEKSVHSRKLEYLEELCGAVPENGPKVVLALDALDQLYSQKMDRYNAVLPNVVSGGVRILVTAVEGLDIPEHFGRVQLPELAGDEILTAIDSIQSSYKKTVSPKVRQALCQRKSAGNLLYLNMVVMRLCLMNRGDFEIINARGGDMEQIERRQQEILEQLPDEAPALAVELLESTASMDSEDGILQALCYLAVSRSGLRMEDMENLMREGGLSLTPLDFYVYTYLLQEFFMVRQNGRIDFQHKIIRNGLLEAMGEDVTACHKQLFAYLHALPATDPLRSTEFVYHAYYSGYGNYIPEYVATVRIYAYYRAAFRMTGKDPKQYAPADFSVDVDYDFLCQQMAADLHTIIMSENIDKIEKLVQMIISLPPDNKDKGAAPIYWVEFLNKMLPVAFGETDDELRMLYTIFGCILVYIQALCKVCDDPTATRNLALCHKQLARLTSQNTNCDMSDTAVEHIRSYTRLLHKLAEQNKNMNLSELEELADSQDLLMILLLQRTKPEDLPEVLEIGERLLELYDEIGMPEKNSRVHFNMGMAYEQSARDPQTRERAFGHYMKAMKLSLRYAEEKKDPCSITYRILSTIKLGRMCLDVQNYQYAVQIFSISHQYAQAAYEQLRDGQSRQYVLMAQEGLGMALMGTGGESAAQGRQLLMGTLIQCITLLKERSEPGLLEMCQRIQKTLKE